MIKLNTIGHEEWIVTKDKLASTINSGSVDVFATPYMIGLMELTCANSVKKQLQPNQSTVGTNVNVSHLSATPLGMKVWCDSKLIKIEFDRKLTFEVVAYDKVGVIGKGLHERYVINDEDFINKVNKKLTI